jgi:hypothetical protein
MANIKFTTHWCWYAVRFGITPLQTPDCLGDSWLPFLTFVLPSLRLLNWSSGSARSCYQLSEVFLSSVISNGLLPWLDLLSQRAPHYLARTIILYFTAIWTFLYPTNRGRTFYALFIGSFLPPDLNQQTHLCCIIVRMSCNSKSMDPT